MQSSTNLILIITSLFIFSCASQNMYSKSELMSGDSLQITDPGFRLTLEPGDKISLSIWGHDELSVGSVFGIYNSNEVFGKWLQIDPEGKLLLPRIGPIQVGGLSKSEVESKMVQAYDSILINPIISIQIQNHDVSVIGEVIKPGKYELEREITTIPEIIAAAGGFDFYARKNEVVLMRGEQEYALDLTKMSAYQLAHTPLKPGDVLYIPTKGGKILDKKAPTILSAASIITTILLIYSALNE